MKIIISLLLCVLTINTSIAADQSFYKGKYRGWFWFEDAETKRKKQEQQIQSQEAELPPLKQIEQLQQTLEEKKAAMIVNPSIENAKDYMETQAKIFHSAERVSKVWQAALLKYPHLNSLIENPVNQHAVNFKHQLDREQNNQIIKEFAKNYGFIFFFRSDCKYCHEFAEVLASFAKEFDITVEAISLDGGRLEEFTSRQDQNLAVKFNVKITPTVMAYSPSQNKAFPVSQGYLSYDELYKNLTFVLSLLMKEGKI